MISTSKQESQQQPKTKGESFWKQLLSGDFLFAKETIRWYPYLAFVFLLLILIVINEHSMDAKRQRIKALETEYKQTISMLKHNNQYILYDENQKLIQMLNNRGFEKNDKHIYKILIQRPKEDAE
jgi:amino acid permease